MAHGRLRVWTGNSLYPCTLCGQQCRLYGMRTSDYGYQGGIRRSQQPSHFTVIIAKISGVELQATIDHKIGVYQNLVRG